MPSTSKPTSRLLLADRGAGAIRFAVLAAVLAIGYLLGSADANRFAQADSPSTPAHPHIHVRHPDPPIVGVPHDGWAIVGASNDRYYLVRPDGTTILLMSDRRHDLCWR